LLDLQSYWVKWMIKLALKVRTLKGFKMPAQNERQNRPTVIDWRVPDLDVPNHRILERREEVALAKRIELGDLAAKEQLIWHNQKLAMVIARRYYGSNGNDLALFDLYQEGMLGVI